MTSSSTGGATPEGAGRAAALDLGLGAAAVRSEAAARATTATAVRRGMERSQGGVEGADPIAGLTAARGARRRAAGRARARGALGYSFVAVLLPTLITQIDSPSKATPSGYEPTGKVPIWLPSVARNFMTELPV